MAIQTAATLIRDARTAASLTQAELARRAGITQSVVSAYEHGRREPSFATLQRLIAAAGYTLDASLVRSEPGGLLAEVRASAAELRDILGPLGAVDIQIFGSVARGDETSDSDIDLLVELTPDVGAFALLRMQSAAETILGRSVDIVPSDGLKPDVADRVAREAVPL